MNNESGQKMMGFERKMKLFPPKKPYLFPDNFFHSLLHFYTFATKAAKTRIVELEK